METKSCAAQVTSVYAFISPCTLVPKGWDPIFPTFTFPEPIAGWEEDTQEVFAGPKSLVIWSQLLLKNAFGGPLVYPTNVY